MSLWNDIGDRIAWCDAISLYDRWVADPRTYVGAASIGLDYPAGFDQIAIISALGGEGFPSPVESLRARKNKHAARISEQEIHDAEQLMSSRFG